VGAGLSGKRLVPQWSRMRPAIWALAFTVIWAAGASAQEIIVSAAISTKEAVEPLARRFAHARHGVSVDVNLGASGDLEKQIEAGAPVDVFISAGEQQMDALERQGLIRSETRRVFARNVLTVIKPADSALDLVNPVDLLGGRVQRIVIGNPRTVPAGQYAEQSLRSLGLWERLRPRLILAENVRQVLEYVARGEVDAGFVYATDIAVKASQVKEAFRLPEDTYGPIRYPVAVVKESRRPVLAATFIDLLVSREGQAALARLGFQAPLPARAP
jgi:molybdate transport system substrate-binding protein